MDWLAFTRAALPYIPEAKRRHPKLAVEPRKPRVRSNPPNSRFCPQGHEDWYFYRHVNGYDTRRCRTCQRAYRRAIAARKRL